MSINQIPGQLLQGNLERDGNSLAFVDTANSTPVLFLDIANSYVGINTATPQSALDIVGTLNVDTINSHTLNGNITINANVSVAGNITATNIIGNIGNTANVSTSAKILYVATNGNDSNHGSITQPYLTIKAALSAASTAGGNISVHVAPGVYTENNPVTIPKNTALMGDNLRNVTVIPQTPSANLFYVTSGCYVWGITIKGYTSKGFSYDPATPTQNVFVSPYIQNLTSSTTTGTAVYIDGNNVSSISTKAMIVGFFTIINQGGKGIHILVADGVGPQTTTGNIVSQYQGRFVLNNLSNGRPNVNTVMLINGDPEYYTIDTIVPIDAVSCEVLVQQTYLGNAAPGTGVAFYTRSSIIASAHTFEYVGAGTNPATALPQYGGIPIEANEVLQLNGGVVTYTSTDQKGNFKVGDGFIVNQATATITGDAFYKSLFAQMTPYILAISGD